MTTYITHPITYNITNWHSNNLQENLLKISAMPTLSQCGHHNKEWKIYYHCHHKLIGMQLGNILIIITKDLPFLQTLNCYKKRPSKLN